MKANIRKMLLAASIVMVTVMGSMAQRVITGTVYRDGEPAAGITVEAHRGGSMLTSFDGKYKVEADDKTKWIKFTFIDESKRLDISDKQGNNFDFAFSGKLPSEGGDEEVSGDVNTQTLEELMKAQDREFMNELSLYTEFYKQNDYKSALPHWRKVYNQYPKSTENIYIQGIKMYQSMVEKASSPEEKAKNVDELMKIYDKRIKYFNERGYNLGRKATDYLKYKLGEGSSLEGEELVSALKKGYEWLNESVELQGNKTELPVLVLLMQTSKSLFKLGDISQETVVQNYDTTVKILNAIESENADAQRVANVQEVRPYVEDIFGTSGAANCDALISIFTPQFKENSNDVEFIKNMLRRLGKANCDESPLFAEATEKLYQLEPSAEAAFNMARRHVKRDNAEKAKEYYQQAMKQETDKDLLSNYYYEYALFIFAKEHALAEARNYLRKALEIKPDFCEALMLMGDIYTQASRGFEGDDFEKSAVFWLAVDYFERARKAGTDCAVDAAQKAATYRKYFPNKEEAFFRSLQEGQTYKIGGWINESTKVRF